MSYVSVSFWCLLENIVFYISYTSSTNSRYLLCHSFLRADSFINHVDRWLRNSSSRTLIYTVHLPENTFSFSGDSTVDVSAQEVQWIYQNFNPVSFEYLKRQEFPVIYSVLKTRKSDTILKIHYPIHENIYSKLFLLKWIYAWSLIWGTLARS